MRFELAPEEPKSRVVRVRISETLAVRYENAAKNAGLDLAIVLRQALEFAAGDEENAKDIRRKPRRNAE